MTTLVLTDAEALTLGDIVAVAVALKFGEVDVALTALSKYQDAPQRSVATLFRKLDRLLDVPEAGITGAR